MKHPKAILASQALTDKRVRSDTISEGELGNIVIGMITIEDRVIVSKIINEVRRWRAVNINARVGAIIKMDCVKVDILGETGGR